MITVAKLWRHPIKSHGREALDRVTLTEGATFPWDRHWAVTHEASQFDPENPAWVKCRNFMIGTSAPRLAGLWSELDTDNARITLRHADLGEIAFCPDDPDDAAAFLSWVAPLSESLSIRPTGIVSAGTRGMTDSDYPTVSIMTMASHDAVAAHLGGTLEPERWRGNIWLDGTAPWEELRWPGRDIRIGQAVLRIREPIQRCKHTMANPVTGIRDTDTLNVLNTQFGHQDFGVYAEVITGGMIALSDKAEVL